MNCMQESIRESDIDEFLLGMASQVAEREDHVVTSDLHGHVFGPLDFSRRDLMAVNIQRGRDHGLPDYNTARRYFDLDPVTSWDGIITPDPRNPPSLSQVSAILSLVDPRDVKSSSHVLSRHSRDSQQIVFTARCYASAVLAMGHVSVCLCLSVCPSQVGVLSRQLNESSWFNTHSHYKFTKKSSSEKFF